MNRRHAVLLACLALATALARADPDSARAMGLKWLVQTQKGDGSFGGAQGLDVQATAAAVEAMLAGGMTKSPQLGRALSWLANAPGSSVDARAWQAAALAAAGRDAKTLAGILRDERNGITMVNGNFSSGMALWGPFPGYASSFPDTALAWGALRSAGVSYTNDTTELTVTVLCHTLPHQLTAAPWSGAWPYALSQNGQPVHAQNASLAATALTLYELKKQRQANRFFGGSACSKASPADIDSAIASAKAWLIAQANGDGGFAERNPQSAALEASSPSASALAVRALALFAAEGDAAATTAVANARNWLAAQQNPDGSWRGDPFVTARALSALPAAVGTQLTDADNDGLPDVVEQQLGTLATVADAQGALANDANARRGITATAFAAEGTLGQPFAYTLGAGGGSGPYSYTVGGGVLPPGLSLAANGQIGGTPTGVGSYAFDYQITDAGGATTLVIGRIDIAPLPEPAANDEEVPIPAWAQLALGGALLASLLVGPRRRVSG